MVNYNDLGVKRIINAAGTYTKYGGSLILPEVLKAMEIASHNFVDIDELLQWFNIISCCMYGWF